MVDPRADDAVGKRAGVGVGKRQLPGMHRDLHRSVGGRSARQLPSAGEPYRRPCCTERGDARKHVGAGQRSDHRAGRIAKQLSGRRELHQASLIDDADSRGERNGVIERVRDHQRGQSKLVK